MMNGLNQLSKIFHYHPMRIRLKFFFGSHPVEHRCKIHSCIPGSFCIYSAVSDIQCLLWRTSQMYNVTETVNLADGEGYISLDGEEWESAEEQYECNLCLKAYTRRYKESEDNVGNET